MPYAVLAFYTSERLAVEEKKNCFIVINLMYSRRYVAIAGAIIFQNRITKKLYSSD